MGLLLARTRSANMHYQCRLTRVKRTQCERGEGKTQGHPPHPLITDYRDA